MCGVKTSNGKRNPYATKITVRKLIRIDQTLYLEPENSPPRRDQYPTHTLLMKKLLRSTVLFALLLTLICLQALFFPKSPNATLPPRVALQPAPQPARQRQDPPAPEPPTATLRRVAERSAVEAGEPEREREGEEWGEAEEEDGMREAMEQEAARTRSPLTGDVPSHKLIDAVRQRDAQWATAHTSAAISGITWTERGPSNVGGRTRALHYDLNDATYKKVWAGSVAGGIWYTSDISATTPTWTKVNDFLDNLAVTSIAQSPANKQYFYASTGEGWFNTDAIRGGGIFRSTDGGANWSQLSSTSVSSISSTFSYVQKVVVTSGGVVLAATKYGGLQRSTDNGSSWARVLGNASFNGTSGYGSIADIEIAADGTVYASTGIMYAGGIYRSTDNGATWTQIYTSASDEYRIELACAPTAPGTLYALSQKSDNTVKQVQYATAAGTGTPTFTVIGNPSWCDQGTTRTDFTRGQAWYDLIAAVDPNDANVLYAGGVDILKYSVASSSWTQVSQWASGCSSRPYVHADIHALVFKPGSSTELLAGSDGGIYRTADGGSSFSTRNSGYNVTQFYSVAVHPSDENYFLAGAQDNGTHKFTSSGVNATSQASGGDGGFCHIDKTESNIQITSYVYNYYYVSTNSGSNFTAYNKNSNGKFINPWDYDDNNNILYAGSSAGTYFRWNSPSTNGSSGEVSVSAFSGASVTCVAVSPTVANRVYFGLDNGDVVMVDNANATPTTTLLRDGTGSVSCVAVNSSDENKILVTYSNYDVTNVYYSSNGTSSSATWTGLDNNLPNMPVRWALFDPRSSSKAFLATELGVWSTDAINGSSTSWGATVGGLANVRVDMLQYNPTTLTLAAATHGRGLFTTTLCGSTSISSQPTAQSICSGSTASFSVSASGAGLSYQWRKGGSNISGATSASYSIAAASAGNAGTYDVVVSGTCGNVTSNSVALTINSTAISTQPTAQSVCSGGTATFTVSATGSSLSYQWRKGGTNISGATSATLTLNNVSSTDAATYDVVVTGTCGSVTSSAVALTVNSLSITSQPSAQSVCTGATATFSVTASGSGLSYQWKKNGTNISGATSATLSLSNVSATDAASYSVVVTGSCGSVTSNAATLSIGATSITTQPVAVSACSGSAAGFSVTAAGSNLSYQWRKGGTNIAGATSAAYTIASVSATDAGSYDVVVTGTCGNVTSNAAALTLNTATVISTQPAAQSVCAGSNATFSVTATGLALAYQWKKGGTNISGATSSSYTVTGATAADAGTYSVAVTGTCGTVTSNSVALTVNSSTSIGTQPVAQTVCSGSTATFTVAATGTSLNYQWRKGGTNISGATSASYSIAAASASDAGAYDVLVTGTCGTVTSTSVNLTVNAATSIGTQPLAQSVCPGGTPLFSVTASGTALTYQWKKNGADISGATAASYFINSASATDAGSYSVAVSGTCGNLTSNAVPLTVNSASAITAQPIAQTVCSGSSATFAVTATGNNLTYQWRKGGTAISGATAATLTLNDVSATDAASYDVVVTGTCGSVTSSTVALTVNAATSITTQPIAQSVCAGSAATFSVSAGGSNLTYQWKKNGTAITGATSATYSLASVANADGGTYTVAVTGSCGTVTSSGATLTVNNAAVIGTQPQSQAVCAGSSATFTVAATGAGLSYQWKKDGTVLAGATAASYTIAAVSASDAGSYTVVVSGTCGNATSNAAILSLNTTPFIGTQPQAQSACAGSTVSFTVAATGTGLSYQWRKGGSNISGATSATLTLNNISGTDAASYDVVITGTCGTVTSSAAALSLTAATVISSNPANQTACPGSTVTFTVAASGAGLSYQWKKDGVAIAGATAASYSIPAAAAADAGSYTVVVTGTCGSATSGAAVLTVSSNPVIGTQPAANQAVCPGSPVSFTVAASGTGLSYQWKKGGAAISGATSATYTIASATATDAGTYSVVVTGSCGSATSTNAVLSVNISTAIGTQPAAQTVCAGTAATFSVSASGTGLSYQWKKNGADISGATLPSYSIAAATAADAGTYTVQVSGTCGTVGSAGATLTVNSTTVINTQPVSAIVCAGTAAGFSVGASGTALSYQWRKDGVSLSGATASSFNLPSATGADAGSYTVDVSGSCGSSTSNAATLTVNAATAIATQPVAQTVCAGSNVSFTVMATGSGSLSYQWKKDGTPISGATSASYSFTGATAAAAGTYTVQVSGSCGSVTSAGALLTVNATTAIGTQPLSQALCAGSSASFTVAATGTGLSYQWRKGGNNIGGATSATLNLGALTAADGGSYDVVVTGTCGSVTSSAALLTVNAATGITTAPVSQMVCSGNSATFTVLATGSGTLTYQWAKDGNTLSGATAATYVIPAVSAASGGSYTVTVTGGCGNITPPGAVLSVNSAPAIATQPAALTTCAGSAASFSVSATGSAPLAYQWKKDGSNLSAATSATYTFGPVSAADNGAYSVTVSNSCGSATSNSVTLTVDACTAVSSLDPDVQGSLLLPNPVTDLATLRVTVRRAVLTHWTVFDGNGRAVLQFSRNALPGRNDFRLSLGGLTAGSYYLVGRTDTGNIGLIRFLRR